MPCLPPLHSRVLVCVSEVYDYREHRPHGARGITRTATHLPRIGFLRQRSCLAPTLAVSKLKAKQKGGYLLQIVETSPLWACFESAFPITPERGPALPSERLVHSDAQP